MNESNRRQYGLDLLRILLALMVITLHFNAGATGQVLSHATVFPWDVIAGVMTTVCYPAVNCYVLICGFFSWKKSIGMNEVCRKLFNLWLCVLFFSIIGYLIVCIATKSFSVLELAKRFVPLLRGKWWYMVDYFALIILSPFINVAIENMSRSQHRNLNIITFILFSVVPMINRWDDQFGVNYGYSLLWFSALYILGAYLSKYEIFENNKIIKRLLQSPIANFLMFLMISASVMVAGKVMSILGVGFYLNPYNSVFSLLQSLFLFLTFANLKIGNQTIIKVIKFIAPLSLASYLFHCQEDMDVYLWQALAPWNYANSVKVIGAYIAILLGIFFVSIILEKIRILLFSGINNRLLRLLPKEK